MFDPWELDVEQRREKRANKYNPRFHELDERRKRTRILKIISPLAWLRDIRFAWKILPLDGWSLWCKFRQSVISAYYMRFPKNSRYYRGW